MAKGQKGQLVTKKHLARQERERRQNRYILITSIAVIIIVVVLIGYGAVQQYLIQPNQPVAKVADNSITTKQFQTFARYERLQLIQQYQQYEQIAQIFGGDQNSQSYVQQYLTEINYRLQPSVVGRDALDYLIYNQLIQKEAEKRNITVSDEEVEQALQEYFGYFPNGTPTPTKTSIPLPTSTLNPTQIVLVPPTSTAAPTVTATPTPVVTITQEVASPTPTIIITPTTTAPTSTPSPTSTPYTLSAFNDDFKSYMTNINSFADLNEADFRWIFKMNLVRQKVFDMITADISIDQDQVWARHIVATDETQAKAIYDRLINGENFEVVATEVYSGTGSTNAIDLGWFLRDSLEAPANSIVFDLQIGQISEPIQTSNGWEIYQVLGHDVRTLSSSQFEQLKQTKFQDWLDEQKAAEDVQEFEIWKDRVPTSPTIPPTQASQ